MASNVWRQSPSGRLRSEHLLRTWPSAEIADDFFEAPTALEGPFFSGGSVATVSITAHGAGVKIGQGGAEAVVLIWTTGGGRVVSDIIPRLAAILVGSVSFTRE